MATVFDGETIDAPDGEPPVNQRGDYVCGRACRDGSRCMADVSLPYIACYQHDRRDPIVTADRDDSSPRA